MVLNSCRAVQEKTRHILGAGYEPPRLLTCSFAGRSRVWCTIGCISAIARGVEVAITIVVCTVVIRCIDLFIIPVFVGSDHVLPVL
jgi:hypothetical protein